MWEPRKYFLELVTRLSRIIHSEYEISLPDLTLMLREVGHILDVCDEPKKIELILRLIRAVIIPDHPIEIHPHG
jgi:hypothetical protein